MDVTQRTPPGLPHHQLDRLGVTLMLPLHLGEQLDTGGEGVLLHLQLDLGVFGLVPLLLPGIHAKLVALDHIPDRVPLLHRVVVPALGGTGLLLSLLQPVLQLVGLPADRPVPVHNLLGRGGQGGQQGFRLCGPGGAQVSPGAQLLQLAGQCPRGAGGLLRLPASGLQGGPSRLQSGLNLTQADLALLNLLRQGALPALLLLQIGPDALGRLQVVPDAAL